MNNISFKISNYLPFLPVRVKRPSMTLNSFSSVAVVTASPFMPPPFPPPSLPFFPFTLPVTGLFGVGDGGFEAEVLLLLLVVVTGLVLSLLEWLHSSCDGKLR